MKYVSMYLCVDFTLQLWTGTNRIYKVRDHEYFLPSMMPQFQNKDSFAVRYLIYIVSTISSPFPEQCHERHS